MLQRVTIPAPLPPYALAFFALFAFLPFPLAAAVYCALLIVAMTAAVRLYEQLTGVSSIVLNLVFAPITATVTYYVGQPVPLALLALALAAHAMRRERWGCGSAFAIAATIEPHVGAASALAMFCGIAETRIWLCAAAAGITLLGAAVTGVHTSVEYLAAVLPAHAVANAYEWQFSLTSILTSVGWAPTPAIRAGEAMFALMTAAGVAVALRLQRVYDDRALTVLVPPAFAVFGGVHIHFQQLVAAFPALLAMMKRSPRMQIWFAGGLAAMMVPWNVMGTTVLAGAAPLVIGAFCAQTIGRRLGAIFSAAGACVVLSLYLMIYLGMGPQQPRAFAGGYNPTALAETSWGDFSRAELMRPSAVMQWLRVPTLLGLGLAVFATARVAFRLEPRRAIT
jgi:hypothetical protein